MCIPNEWWDRPRLIEHMEVARPEPRPGGLLVIEFKGRCYQCTEMAAIFDANRREEIERVVVPSVLEALTTARWNVADAAPLEPVSRPFGTPTEWDGPGWPPASAFPGLPKFHQMEPPAYPPEPEPPAYDKADIIQDLVRLAVGQEPSIAKQLVLKHALECGIVDALRVPKLLHGGRPGELILEADEDRPPPKTKAVRRRIVDT